MKYDTHADVAALSKELRRHSRNRKLARRILIGTAVTVIGAFLTTLYAFSHAEYANGDSARLTDKQVTQLFSPATDSERVSVLRIRDGQTTCYVAYSKGNGSVPYGTSVSCVK